MGPDSSAGEGKDCRQGGNEGLREDKGEKGLGQLIIFFKVKICT